MPVPETLLQMLVCPAAKVKLVQAQADVLEALNRRIAEGALRNRGGAKVDERLEDGLLTADGRWLYPIRSGVPVLLIEEAVPVAP